MAKNPTAASADVRADRPVCGVIMPISKTASHPEKHWIDVQTLLHRAIEGAGFEAKNVWENSTTDRISERILANIFSTDIVIADISDLNPNVMLELGLRLSSKNPTIVICNRGMDIPFDIRDFHVILYPPDLNILEMENFFGELEGALKEKHEAFSKGEYTPFLGGISVDVVSPPTREISMDQLVVSSLEDISNRLRQLERRSSAARTGERAVNTFISGSRLSEGAGRFMGQVPSNKFEELSRRADELFEVDEVQKVRDFENDVTFRVKFSGADDISALRAKISNIATSLGGRLAIMRPSIP